MYLIVLLFIILYIILFNVTLSGTERSEYPDLTLRKDKNKQDKVTKAIVVLRLYPLIKKRAKISLHMRGNTIS